MFVLKSDVVPYDELAATLDHLPGHSSGLSRDATLSLWQEWHRSGSLQLGRVEYVLADGSRQTQALGITLWISDAAVLALSVPAASCCRHRVYSAAQQGLAWPMQTAEILAAHNSGSLNLMVLHFWSRDDVHSPEFQPVFLQAHTLFRDVHQGFGVQAIYQEAPPENEPFLLAAGMDVLHRGLANDPAAWLWMGLSKKRAVVKSGCTFSFLFFSPERRLALSPAVQRMLALAVRQITDDEIAAALGCSRDYVRKLWSQAYDSMEQVGVLKRIDDSAASTASPVRGRERRRTAIEFLRANPHEMRPGLLAARRSAADASR